MRGEGEESVALTILPHVRGVRFVMAGDDAAQPFQFFARRAGAR